MVVSFVVAQGSALVRHEEIRSNARAAEDIKQYNRVFYLIYECYQTIFSKEIKP